MSILEPTNGRNPSHNLSCPHCNIPLPPQAVFCSFCGERIKKNEEWETHPQNGNDDTQTLLKVSLQSELLQSLPTTPTPSISEMWQHLPETEVLASLSEELTAPSIPVPGTDIEKHPLSQHVWQRVTRPLSAVSPLPQRKVASNLSGSDWLWPTIIILSAVAAGLVNFAFTDTAIHPIIVFWFLFICPGMALVRLLRLKEPVVEWTLALALSFSIDAIVAGIQLYAGGWSPTGTLLILIGLSLTGAFVQLVTMHSATTLVPKRPFTMLLRQPGLLITIPLISLIGSNKKRFSTVERFWNALWQVSDAKLVRAQITEAVTVASTEENAELDTNPLAQKLAGPPVADVKVPKSDAGIVVQQTAENETAPSTEPASVARANLAIQGTAESTEQAEQVPTPIINPMAPQPPKSEVEDSTEKLPVVLTNPVVPQTPEPPVETEHPLTLDTDSTLQRTPELTVVPAIPLEPPIISQEKGTSVPVHLQERPHGYHRADGEKRKDVKRFVSVPRKQALALLVLIIILLGSIGIGTSVWFYAASQHRSTSTLPTSLHPSSPTSRVTPTPTPVPPLYPNIVPRYTGTLHDIPMRTTTNISFTSIQQQQGNIKGYFSGMSGNTPFNGMLQNGPFTGTVTIAKQIQFIVMDNTGQATFSFDGLIQPDGTMVGTYCSLGDAPGKCSDYGLWSVSPAT